jgi:hypothetical protein
MQTTIPLRLMLCTMLAAPPLAYAQSLALPDQAAFFLELDADPAGTAAAPATAAVDTAAVGTALGADQLDRLRGGFNINEVSSTSISEGTLQDTSASHVVTGWNTINGGAFAHSSGLPVVIQNSGANVLIQNSTVVTVQFK